MNKTSIVLSLVAIFDFCLIWSKLLGTLNWSWWAVLSPTLTMVIVFTALFLGGMLHEKQ